MIVLTKNIKPSSKMTIVRNKKNIIHYLKRPEYYFRLTSVIRKLFRSQHGVINQKTPWGSQIEIDVNETIGNSIYSTQIYDLPLSETLWRLTEPGNFVLDIGANIGFITGLCSFKSGPGGKVWAFEPNPKIIKRLTTNIEYNHYPNTTLHPFALSDSNKEGYLEFPDIFSYNHGVAYVGNNGTHSANAAKINLRKLDDMIDAATIINVVVGEAIVWPPRPKPRRAPVWTFGADGQGTLFHRMHLFPAPPRLAAIDRSHTYAPFR